MKKVQLAHDTHPKLGKLEVKYVAYQANYTFGVAVKELKNGKWVPIPLINMATQTPMVGPNNQPMYQNKDLSFICERSSSSKGSRSIYNVFEKTPEYIKERLIQLCKKGEIVTYEDHVKNHNPDQWKQYVKDKDTVNAADEAITNANAIADKRVEEARLNARSEIDSANARNRNEKLELQKQLDAANERIRATEKKNTKK